MKQCDKKSNLLSYSATSSFTDIYHMVNFDRLASNPKPAGLRAIEMPFLNFLSQKTYPGELRPKVA